MRYNLIKLLLVTILGLMMSFVGEAQNLSSFDNNLRFGKDAIGNEITFIDIYKNNGMFYKVQPDTIWIKKVKKPKLDKHYRLSYIYDGSLVGRTFLIKDVNFCEKEVVNSYENRYKVYTLTLEDNSTGEIVCMKIERNERQYVLEFRIRNLNLYNQLRGKDFIDSKTGKMITIKDCFYPYKSIGGDGWCLDYRMNEELLFELEDGDTIYAKYSSNYMSPSDYEKYKKEEELKQLERKAETGEWKIVYKNATKPQSNKFKKGQISFNSYSNKVTYTDNYVSLKLTVEKENFSFELKNISPNTITIDWDEIIYINTDSESQRVVHSGIKYRDKNNPQQPSLVAKQSILKDILIPVDRIKWMVDEWWVGPILNWRVTPGYYNGKQVQLIFPIKVNGVSYEYTFLFDLIWEWTYPQEREKWLQMKESK